MAYNSAQPRDTDGKFSGGLMDSLEHQLMQKNPTTTRVAAHSLAIEIMTNQGTYDPKTGTLTAKGVQRETMGHKARVIDRVARATGHKPEEVGIQNKRPYIK